jgi:SagB-type dehydrogenase family enzyme
MRLLLLATVAAAVCACGRTPSARANSSSIRGETVNASLVGRQDTVHRLSEPNLTGERSLEATLAGRRSVREFRSERLNESEVAQLLWAAQGVTSSLGLRAAPSAGALYPLELYVVTAEGTSRYDPHDHALEVISAEDLRARVQRAALRQEPVGAAPAVFMIAGVFERTAAKYGRRAPRYVHMEAGHAAQNLLLQAEALGLGGVPIGAFDDDAVAEALSLPDDHAPLYLIPVGHPR